MSATPDVTAPLAGRHTLRYRVLARAIASLHAAYAMFAVFGGLLVLRWPSLMMLHLLAVLWALATMTLDLGCYLTHWEKALWRRGGSEPYPEGFLQHHVLRHTFPEERSRLYHAMLGAAALALNVAIYGLLVLR